MARKFLRPKHGYIDIYSQVILEDVIDEILNTPLHKLRAVILNVQGSTHDLCYTQPVFEITRLKGSQKTNTPVLKFLSEWICNERGLRTHATVWAVWDYYESIADEERLFLRVWKSVLHKFLDNYPPNQFEKGLEVEVKLIKAKDGNYYLRLVKDGDIKTFSRAAIESMRYKEWFCTLYVRSEDKTSKEDLVSNSHLLPPLYDDRVEYTKYFERFKSHLTALQRHVVSSIRPGGILDKQNIYTTFSRHHECYSAFWKRANKDLVYKTKQYNSKIQVGTITFVLLEQPTHSHYYITIKGSRFDHSSPLPML